MDTWRLSTDLKNYFHTSLFEKFLDMAPADTTYCLNETSKNNQKYKHLEEKKVRPSDRKTWRIMEVDRINSLTLPQSTISRNFIKDLTVWSDFSRMAVTRRESPFRKLCSRQAGVLHQHWHSPKVCKINQQIFGSLNEKDGKI